MNYLKYREFREAKNVGIRELARQLDISPTYISQVETGKEPRGYSTETTMKMVLALGLNREQAKEMLAGWRAFHASEVARIDQFLAELGEREG